MNKIEIRYDDLHSKIRQSGIYNKYKGRIITLDSSDILLMAKASNLDDIETQEWIDIWLSEFSYQERKYND